MSHDVVIVKYVIIVINDLVMFCDSALAFLKYGLTERRVVGTFPFYWRGGQVGGSLNFVYGNRTTRCMQLLACLKDTAYIVVSWVKLG